MLQSEALQILEQKISQCTLCKDLTEHRIANNGKTVPGTGNPNAKIFVLGEAPGADEEKSGQPFVGKAGRLLTSILEAAGWSREEVFIANILKCRPPNNRDPEKAEADNCRKFLEMQIKCVNPQWIICFGRIASINLLGLDPSTTIGSLRGEIHEYQGRKVIATYHPSYLLRQPSAKKSVWEDLQPVRQALQSPPATV